MTLYFVFNIVIMISLPVHLIKVLRIVVIYFIILIVIYIFYFTVLAPDQLLPVARAPRPTFHCWQRVMWDHFAV